MITVLKSSFVQHKLTILRNKKTSNTVFRQTMNEASYLIAAEVLKHISFKKIRIQVTKNYFSICYNFKTNFTCNWMSTNNHCPIERVVLSCFLILTT